MAVPYNHREIEQKWRKIWEEHPVNVNDGKKPKYYCLDMFPYPQVAKRIANIRFFALAM